jgi:hypothetical protein
MRGKTEYQEIAGKKMMFSRWRNQLGFISVILLIGKFFVVGDRTLAAEVAANPQSQDQLIQTSSLEAPAGEETEASLRVVDLIQPEIPAPARNIEPTNPSTPNSQLPIIPKWQFTQLPITTLNQIPAAFPAVTFPPSQATTYYQNPALARSARHRPIAQSPVPTDNNSEPSPTPSPTPNENLPPTPTPLPANYTIEFFSATNPRIPANNRSTVTLEGKITDTNGEIIEQDILVTLTASAGKFVGKDFDQDLAGFQVLAKKGEFSVQLRSSLEPQKVKIRAAIADRFGRDSTPIPAPISGEQGSVPPLNQPLGFTPPPAVIETYTQVEFITNLRPSLLSGVIDFRVGNSGTNFWSSRSEFLNPDRIGKGTEVNLTGAVFSTAPVGEWLFTGAYNSERPLNKTCDGITRLFRGPQFCEQQYPVYGDSSTVDYITPSIDSVYARIERTSPEPGMPTDYFLWGDYSTQEFARTSQLFTATTRQLHGLKTNYSLGNLQITGMFANNLQGFQRDTITPNGTSGYYFLSRRAIVEGSENVFLETEEINRPGTVVDRQPLSRGPDYEIDYSRGTLMFRRPILSTEFNPLGMTLVRRIVSTYQYEGTGQSSNLYAGRFQYNFEPTAERQSWLATSYLREDLGSQKSELYGADFFVPLGSNGQVVGEFARASNSSALYFGNIAGNAYRLEASGNIIPELQARGYYRSTETGFANNATTSFTPGQTRTGGAIAAALSSTTSLTTSYDYEANFGIAPATRFSFSELFNPTPTAIPGSRVDNDLRTFQAGIVQKIDASDISFQYVNRSRTDRIGNVFNTNSNQLVSHLNLALADTLFFRAQNELNLSGTDPLYPNRSTFGLDWAAYPGVTFRVAHQFFDGGLFSRNSITSLDTILERPLGENTSLTGRYSLISGFNTVTGQGAVGLNHRWAVAPGFRINLGYERIFGDLFAGTAAGSQFAQPYAVGQSASSLGLASGDAYSVGMEYTELQDFKASARYEYRIGSTGSSAVINATAAGKLSPALTGLARYEQGNFANQLVRGLGDTINFKLGLAYRDPASDEFNGLLRYEYRQNPSTIPDTLLLGSGTGATDHVFSAEGIYAPSWDWEFYSKFAIRFSNTFLAQNFSNSSSVYLGQMRVTYRTGYDTDLAVEARLIGQPSVNYNEIGLAVEGGYYLTPDLRAYVGYSFGGVDDRDFTGYRSAGGAYAGITIKLNDLFGLGRQYPEPPPPPKETATSPNNPTTIPANALMPAR